MGRELQKKKNKSSLPRVKQKPKSKRLHVPSNPIIAAHWSSKQTLSQNYRRLGLTSKLNARAGGTEPSPSSLNHNSNNKNNNTKVDSLSIGARAQKLKSLIPTTARVVRDPVSGAITKVLGPSSDSRGEEEGGGGGGGGGRGANPLNDPLNAFDSEDDEDDGRRGEKDDSEEGVDDERRGKKDVGVGIVRELEEAARAGEGGGKKRMQSRREKEWIETLVERWGEDWGGMMRDRRLNPQQHGEGDLKRRVRRWREERGQTMAVI